MHVVGYFFTCSIVFGTSVFVIVHLMLFHFVYPLNPDHIIVFYCLRCPLDLTQISFIYFGRFDNTVV